MQSSPELAARCTEMDPGSWTLADAGVRDVGFLRGGLGFRVG